MKVLIQDANCETVIKNSRFIAEAFTVRTQAEAKDKIHQQKLRYPDATHVCHCFVLGPKAETCGMSDDGEPSGTAGRPMLDVLKGSGVTNILVTVTRYFGGTLLGTGGLVHAYGGCVKSVLEVCQTEELVEKSSFMFSSDYNFYDAIKRLLPNFHISNLNEEYSTDVFATGEIWTAEGDDFSQQIKNLTKGKTIVEFGETSKNCNF